MPSVPAPPSVVLLAAGFILGFATASGLCLAWRAQDRRTRRLVLGFAATALADALARLQESIEVNALDSNLLREVGGCRDLAAAVAKVAVEYRCARPTPDCRER